MESVTNQPLHRSWFLKERWWPEPLPQKTKHNWHKGPSEWGAGVACPSRARRLDPSAHREQASARGPKGGWAVLYPESPGHRRPGCRLLLRLLSLNQFFPERQDFTAWQGTKWPRETRTRLNSRPELRQNLKHVGTGLGHGWLPEQPFSSTQWGEETGSLQPDFNYQPFSEPRWGWGAYL